MARRSVSSQQRGGWPVVCGRLTPAPWPQFGSSAPRPPPPPNPPSPTQVVTVKRFNKKYVLYQCGTPDPTKLPPGSAAGIAPGMPSFEIPLFSVAVTDTTVNGFLVGFGGRRRGPARLCFD